MVSPLPFNNPMISAYVVDLKKKEDGEKVKTKQQKSRSWDMMM